MGTNTHRVVESGSFTATEAGALDGHFARCSCGFQARTSLDERFAIKDANAHAEYMNRKEQSGR